jgi:hypothetical protein
VGEPALHVAADVSAVRALWDRSGLLAGPAIAAQLSAFTEALAVAHAARERGAAVLLSNRASPRYESAPPVRWSRGTPA